MVWNRHSEHWPVSQYHGQGTFYLTVEAVFTTTTTEAWYPEETGSFTIFTQYSKEVHDKADEGFLGSSAHIHHKQHI